MKFELRTLDTPRGTYHGLYHPVVRDKLAIHVHGTWGNFYENPIATWMAQAYADSGYSFASVNVPGKDFESVHEDLASSSGVMSAWVGALAPDVKSLIWQGHSLGSLKIVRHVLSNGGPVRPSAAVLFAPFDIRAFNAQSVNADEMLRKYDLASAAVSAGRADELVPSDLFDVWPISYGAWKSCLDPRGPLNLFPSSAGDVGEIPHLGIPTLVCIGGADVAASPSPVAVVDLIREKAPSVPAHLMGQAPHNLAGQEAEVEAILRSFLASVDLRSSR